MAVAGGQLYCEAGASLRRLAYSDIAPVIDDDLAHDGQAKPGAALAVGYVGVENVLALVLGNARTIVVDQDGGALAARFGLRSETETRAAATIDFWTRWMQSTEPLLICPWRF